MPQPIKTVVADYGATGEGRTLFIYIGYAHDAETAITDFGRKFDPYFAQGADVYDGLRLDIPGYETLISKEMGDRLQALYAEGRANISFATEFHINYS